MKAFFLPLAIVFIHTIAHAQADSTNIYYTADYVETTPDKAVTYITFTKTGDLWLGKERFAKSAIVKSEGTYADKNFIHPLGTFKNYSDKGVLENISLYGDSSKPVERTYFYKDGSKRSYIKYLAKNNEQKCWDESGREVAKCEVEKPATFKGGLEGWRKYLEKNLDASIPASVGAPVGNYTVTVQFVVNKEGQVSKVRATDVPKACKACGAEVVRVIVEGPDWEPAVINGERVVFQAMQLVTFVVEEQGGKKRKG